MIIWIIISICFIFLFSRFLPRNNILLLNFYSYIVFFIISLFQLFLSWVFEYKFYLFSSHWEYDSLIFMFSYSIIFIIYFVIKYFWWLKKYFKEQIHIIFSLFCHNCLLFFLLWWLGFIDGKQIWILKVYSDKDIVCIILMFLFLYLFIVYILWYVFEFLWKIFTKEIILNKQLFKWILWKIKNNILYIFRDFWIIVWFVIITILISDIHYFYSKYYNRYKNPDNFTNQVYVCEDDTKMILEQHYRHHPIINPYDSFFDFYNYYAEKHGQLDYEINQLHSDKINKQYLGKCISQNGNNYFDEYVRIHGKQPRNYIRR